MAIGANDAVAVGANDAVADADGAVADADGAVADTDGAVADADGAVDDADGNDIVVVEQNAAGPAQAGLLKSIRNKKISNEVGHSKSIR